MVRVRRRATQHIGPTPRPRQPGHGLAGPWQTIQQPSAAPGARRSTRWQVECENGALGDPPAERPEGLFARDLACFVARVTERAEPYVADSVCLRVLELVEAIERRLC